MVFYLYCDFIEPPDNKYLLLVAIIPEPLWFFINSRINTFKSNSPALSACQVRLKQADHSFLSWDSFVDCSKADKCFSLTYVRNRFLSDSKKTFKGQITSLAKKEICSAMMQSITLEGRYKKMIFEELCQ